MKLDDKKTVQSLRSLYTNEADYRKILDHLASRSNNANETKVDRLSDVTGLSRSRIVEFMRQLEQLGLGEFIVGRKGGRSRFRWQVGLVSVGQVASKESDEISTEAPEEVSEDEMELASDAVTYEVPLRADMKARITVPSNITKVETIRLSNFIRGLAVDVGETG
jgi:hypothetical protein